MGQARRSVTVSAIRCQKTVKPLKGAGGHSERPRVASRRRPGREHEANVDRPRLIFPSFENMANVLRRMPLAFSSAAARLGFLFLHRYNSGLGGKCLAAPILAYLSGRGKLPNVKRGQSANPTRFFRVVLINRWPDFVFVRAVQRDRRRNQTGRNRTRTAEGSGTEPAPIDAAKLSRAARSRGLMGAASPE